MHPPPGLLEAEETCGIGITWLAPCVGHPFLHFTHELDLIELSCLIFGRLVANEYCIWVTSFRCS
jgi:hypothetical protein